MSQEIIIGDIGLAKTSISSFVSNCKIEKLDAESFKKNKNILEISLSSVNQQLPDGIFANCTNLTSLQMPALKCIDNKIFGKTKRTYPKKLKKIKFNDCTEDIGCILSGLEQLEEIKFPLSLKVLSENALFGDKSIKTLNIPRNTIIEDKAFESLVSLENLSCRIEESNQNLGLSNLDNLQKITILNPENTLYVLKSDLLANLPIKQLEFEDCAINLRQIENGALSNLEYLTEIDFSNSMVQELPSNAFAKDASLSLVQMNSNCFRSLKINAFEGIDEVELSGNQNLQHVEYPGTKVNYLDKFAKSAMEIGPSAFYQASFNDPIETLAVSVGEFAFTESNLKAIFLQFGKSNQKELKLRTFANCKDLNIAIVSQISSVGIECFQNCENLQQFSIDCNFNALDSAFENCINLSSFPIENLKYAGNSSFSNCNKLFDSDDVDLFNVDFIGNRAFNNAISCDKLVLNGQLLIEDKIRENAFNGCNIGVVELKGIDLLQLQQNETYKSNDLVDTYNTLKQLFGIVNDVQFELENVVIRKDGKGNSFNCLVVEDRILKSVNSSANDYQDFLKEPIIPFDVDEIGESAFSNFSQLVKIDLNNVEKISKTAFAKCQNLKSVIAPRLHSICEYAFIDCENLEKFDFFAVESIKKNAFRGCKKLEEVIGNCIINIDEGAFLNCISLQNVQSQSILKIGSIAFGNCISLSKVNFEQSGLEIINKYAFIGCKALVDLKLGNKVQIIDEYALKDTNSKLIVIFKDMYPMDAINVVRSDNVCSSSIGTKFGISQNGNDRFLLQTINDNEIIRIQDNVRKVALFKAGNSIDDIFDVKDGILLGIKDENVKEPFEATINGNNISAIASNALATTRKLEKLIVNPSVNLTISSQAFSYNSSLKEVNLGNNVISIADDAFNRCAIEKITLPPFSQIGGYGLNDSYALSSLQYSNGTREILPSAMIDCGPILTDVKFPLSLSSIGKYAFAETKSFFPNISATQLRELTNLVEIGDYAFYNSLRTVDNDVLRIPSKVKKIGSAAFGYNEDAWTFTISALEVPETVIAANVQNIGPSAFIFNGLRNIVFNVERPSLTSIGDYAFAYPKKKYSIRIPKTIEHIGIGAFKKNVILNPDYVKKNIISIDLDSDADILRVINSTSATDFTALNTISVTDHTCLLATGDNAKENRNFLYALDGKLNLCPDTMQIDIQNKTILSVTDHAITSSLIPKYVNVIGEVAYKDCTQLTSISSLNPNIQMQSSAFYNCNSLKYFNGPEEFYIDKADPYLFWNCQSIENIRLLSTSNYIGECAFYNCKSLTSLQDKDNRDQIDYWTLQSIGPSAFLSCSRLKEFIIPRNILSIGANSFDGCSDLERIYIDCSSLQFKEIVDSDDEIGEIVRSLFNGIRDDAKCEIIFNDIVYMNDGNVKLDNDIVEFREISEGISAISSIDIFELEDRDQDYLNLSAIAIIDNFIFRNVDQLRTFNILPNDDIKLSVIGDFAFSKCTNLQHVNGDKLSCASIGQHAFDSCIKLEEMQLDLNMLSSIEKGAFAKSSLKHLIFYINENIDESSEEEFLPMIQQKVHFDEKLDLNPMTLPEDCQIAVINRSNEQIALYDCQFHSLMHSDIDINRNQIVFVDKNYGSVKPLLLVKPKDENHLPSIAKNEFHVNIIGRWK